MAEVDSLVCQLLGLSRHHDAVALGAVFQLLNQFRLLSEVLALFSGPGQVDLQRHNIVSGFEMLRIFLLDLSVEIFLHGEIVHVLPKEVLSYLAIALPVEVKTDIVDEAP